MIWFGAIPVLGKLSLPMNLGVAAARQSAASFGLRKFAALCRAEAPLRFRGSMRESFREFSPSGKAIKGEGESRDHPSPSKQRR